MFYLGGGAPEMEVAVQLRQLAQERHGAEQYCWRVCSLISSISNNEKACTAIF